MMRVLVLPLLVLLASCGSQSREPASGTAELTQESFAPLTAIRSSKIDLPADEETFGEGPHGDLLNRTCLACHSSSMVRYQPPLSRKQWTATVNKMREAYGAPFEKSEIGAIVDALVATQPTKP